MISNVNIRHGMAGEWSAAGRETVANDSGLILNTLQFVRVGFTSNTHLEQYEERHLSHLKSTGYFPPCLQGIIREAILMFAG